MSGDGVEPVGVEEDRHVEARQQLAQQHVGLRSARDARPDDQRVLSLGGGEEHVEVGGSEHGGGRERNAHQLG
jgi:hypothetical protein